MVCNTSKIKLYGLQIFFPMWRYGQDTGTYFHMQWKCDFTLTFWKIVFKEITEILCIEMEACSKIAVLIIENDQWGQTEN